MNFAATVSYTRESPLQGQRQQFTLSIKWKNLRSATFFHAAAGRKVPFDGNGCAAIAGLPHFESFSMSGVTPPPLAKK